MRTYSELLTFQTFKERYDYLMLGAKVGDETFGYDRYLNQVLYTSQEWRSLRDKIIIRDNGCDLAHEDHPLVGRVYIHHMNPITLRDINERNKDIFNPEYLICCSMETHNAIHYGTKDYGRAMELVERRPNDTCPWKSHPQDSQSLL